MKPPRATPTQSLLSKTKRLAKARSRETGQPHSACLEVEAAAAGYSSWHELQQACAAPSKADFALLVDPTLPPSFDDTPNENRSKRHLDEWWDRPFALSKPGGGFTVRCLDGGAWDRSTWYGEAKDLDDAVRLAQAKLAIAREDRSRPLLYLGAVARVIRLADRPDQDQEILYESEDFDDARRWMSENFPEAPSQ